MSWVSYPKASAIFFSLSVLAGVSEIWEARRDVRSYISSAKIGVISFTKRTLNSCTRIESSVAMPSNSAPNVHHGPRDPSRCRTHSVSARRDDPRRTKIFSTLSRVPKPAGQKARKSYRCQDHHPVQQQTADAPSSPPHPPNLEKPRDSDHPGSCRSAGQQSGHVYEGNPCGLQAAHRDRCGRAGRHRSWQRRRRISHKPRRIGAGLAGDEGQLRVRRRGECGLGVHTGPVGFTCRRLVSRWFYVLV